MEKLFFYHGAIFYVDPISRQTYSSATENPRNGQAANGFAVNPDGKDYFSITCAKKKQDIPVHFKSSEIRSAIGLNTLSARTFKFNHAYEKFSRDFY